MTTDIGRESADAKRTGREIRPLLTEVATRARVSLLFPCKNRLRTGLWLVLLMGLLAASPAELFVSTAEAAQATGDSAEVKLPRPKIIARKRIALPPREGMTGYKAPRKKVAAKAMPAKATKAAHAPKGKAKAAKKPKKARTR